ncbi:MAG: hypothetical protein PHQ31_07350, partial [Acidaminococcaceae bacterium]|nr:hypothetical protein [Acidaminococcaceae bacterium]
MINELLQEAVLLGASDVHLTVGLPPIFRINGALTRTDRAPLANADTFNVAESMLDSKRHKQFLEEGEVDFSYVLPEGARFRV